MKSAILFLTKRAFEIADRNGDRKSAALFAFIHGLVHLRGAWAPAKYIGVLQYLAAVFLSLIYRRKK